MICTNYGLIGTSFLTGQKAPVSGVYTMVRHIHHTGCCASDEEREITLREGEPFPSHCGCNRRVIWQLSQYSWVTAAGRTCSFTANLSPKPALQAAAG